MSKTITMKEIDAIIYGTARRLRADFKRRGVRYTDHDLLDAVENDAAVQALFNDPVANKLMRQAEARAFVQQEIDAAVAARSTSMRH
jgi:hypothetical protein